MLYFRVAFKCRTIDLHSFSGGFHYLHVGKPNLNIRLDSLMAQPDYVSSGFPSLWTVFRKYIATRVGEEFIALLMMLSFCFTYAWIYSSIQFFSTARIFTSLNIELVVIQDSFNCVRGLQKAAYQQIDLKFDLKSCCNDSVHEFLFQ